MKFTVDVITEKCVVVSFENGAKVQCQSRKAAALLVSNTIMTAPEPAPKPVAQAGSIADVLANMYAPVKALPAPKPAPKKEVCAATKQAARCASNLVALYENRYNWQTGEVTPKVPAKTLASTVRDIIDSNKTWSTSKSFEVSGFFPTGYRAWVQLNSVQQITILVMNMKNRKRQSSWVVGSLQADGWAPVKMIDDNIRLAQQWVEKDSK